MPHGGKARVELRGEPKHFSWELLTWHEIARKCEWSSSSMQYESCDDLQESTNPSQYGSLISMSP
jgi:hypothetical protein